MCAWGLLATGAARTSAMTETRMPRSSGRQQQAWFETGQVFFPMVAPAWTGAGAARSAVAGAHRSSISASRHDWACSMASSSCAAHCHPAADWIYGIYFESRWESAQQSVPSKRRRAEHVRHAGAGTGNPIVALSPGFPPLLPRARPATKPEFFVPSANKRGREQNGGRGGAGAAQRHGRGLGMCTRAHRSVQASPAPAC